MVRVWVVRVVRVVRVWVVRVMRVCSVGYGLSGFLRVVRVS